MHIFRLSLYGKGGDMNFDILVPNSYQIIFMGDIFLLVWNHGVFDEQKVLSEKKLPIYELFSKFNSLKMRFLVSYA